MTQPTALQADVQLRTMRPNDARQAMANPADIRRGEVRSITLTIPLLTDANSYLVVRLPDEAVRGMLAHVRTLPPGERADFIRDWVMRNQRAVIDQHVRSGTGTRRFRYDVVPVQAQPRVTEATPRRVEPAPQPAATTVPRLEAPRAAAPQPAPTGRVIQPGAPSRPATVSPAPAETAPPLRERTVEPPAPRRVELPPMPTEIKGGNGSSRRPYLVFMTEAELQRRRGRSTTVDIPMLFDIEPTGQLRFRILLTEEQASPANRANTQAQVWRIVQAVYRRVAAERGSRLESSAFRDALGGYNRAFARAMAAYDRATEE